jgi:hypothetical protein
MSNFWPLLICAAAVVTCGCERKQETKEAQAKPELPAWLKNSRMGDSYDDRFELMEVKRHPFGVEGGALLRLDKFSGAAWLLMELSEGAASSYYWMPLGEEMEQRKGNAGTR